MQIHLDCSTPENDIRHIPRIRSEAALAALLYSYLHAALIYGALYKRLYDCTKAEVCLRARPPDLIWLVPH